MVIDASTVFNTINVVILTVTAIILIRQISEMRRAANLVIGWLLTERPHFGPVCANDWSTEPSEIAWHEAYRENGAERPWFSKWWLRSDLP